MALYKSKRKHGSHLEETWWTMQKMKSKMGSDAEQSASFANTNRVLPVSCLNFHSIELWAGKLSIWCRRLLCLTAVSEVEKTRRRRRREKGKHFRWNIGNSSRQHRDLWNFLLSSVRMASATRATNGSPSQSFWSLATSTLMHRILTLGHFEVESHRRVHVRGGVHHARQLLLLLLVHHKVAALVVVCVTVD